VSYKDIYSFVRHVQRYITQQGANKHDLLLIFAVYLCALRITREACGLSTPACHLRLGCSAACIMLLPHQWRTQKLFMGGFHSAAQGSHLYSVCAVCDVTK